MGFARVILALGAVGLLVEGCGNVLDPNGATRFHNGNGSPAVPWVQASFAFLQVSYSTPANATTVGGQSKVDTTITNAQSSGNLIIVAAGWNDSTSSVVSVADTSGNSYRLAVGPTRNAGNVSQSIYYALNINAAGAGANTVTVTFNAPAVAFPDIRVLEYDAEPNSIFDVATGASGNGGLPSSGFVTTNYGYELIFGASITTGGMTGAGAGFTNRVITVPDNDDAEDRIVTSAGTYQATAPGTSDWVTQVATFH